MRGKDITPSALSRDFRGEHPDSVISNVLGEVSDPRSLSLALSTLPRRNASTTTHSYILRGLCASALPFCVIGRLNARCLRTAFLADAVCWIAPIPSYFPSLSLDDTLGAELHETCKILGLQFFPPFAVPSEDMSCRSHKAREVWPKTCIGSCRFRPSDQRQADGLLWIKGHQRTCQRIDLKPDALQTLPLAGQTL